MILKTIPTLTWGVALPASMPEADAHVEEHDQRLVLWVQYMCNEKGMKIPWDLIAEKLDPKASEGAIIQHLAKLRTHLLADGHNVPPPLRRGGHGSSARTSANSTPRSGKTDGGEQGTPTKAARTIAVNQWMSSPRMKAEDDDDDDEIASAIKGQLGGVIKIEDDDYDPRRPRKKLRRVVARGTKRDPPREQAELSSEDETESKPVTTEEGVIGRTALINKPSKIVILRIRPGYTSERFPLGLATWSQGSSADKGDESTGKAGSGGGGHVGESGDLWGSSAVPSSPNGLTSNALEIAGLGSTWTDPTFDEYVNQLVLEQAANAPPGGFGSTLDGQTGDLGGQIVDPVHGLFGNIFDDLTGEIGGQIAEPAHGLFGNIFDDLTGDIGGQIAEPAHGLFGNIFDDLTGDIGGQIADPAHGLFGNIFDDLTGDIGGQIADPAHGLFGNIFDDLTGDIGGQITDPAHGLLDNIFDGQTGDIGGQITDPAHGLFDNIFDGQTGDVEGPTANPAQGPFEDAFNSLTGDLEGQTANPAEGAAGDAFNEQANGATTENADGEFEWMLDDLPGWIFDPDLSLGNPDRMSGDNQNNDATDAM